MTAAFISAFFAYFAIIIQIKQKAWWKKLFPWPCFLFIGVFAHLKLLSDHCTCYKMYIFVLVLIFKGIVC